MKTKWKQGKLSTLCHRIGDGLHGTPNYTTGTDYFFINGNNLENGKIVITSETKTVAEAEYKKHFIDLNENTLLLGINGTIGNMAFYSEEQIMLGKSAAYLNFKTNINRFYYYYFQLNGVQKYFYDVATGSTIKNLSLKSIQDFIVPIPDESEYKEIVATLAIIDKKIELNNKISAALEQMARTLYDYWFVQFDFPDRNGKPYKSSGGAMVYNEALKREIPKDWEVKELDQIISKSGTGLNPRDNFELGHGDNFYITIKNVKGGKIIFNDTCDRVDDEALKIINKRSDLQIGDILFTSIEPVGVTYFIHEKPTDWNINESVFTIRANYGKVTAEYLYMLLSGSEMKSFTKNASAGSIHKGIRHNVLKTFRLPYKDKILTEEFSKLVSPILKRIYILDNESQKLADLRDWLLPMLMNGQVTVK